MESLDRDGKSLEKVVEELLNAEDLNLVSDEALKAQAKIQKLRGELRKYLSRPKYYHPQISYIKRKIKEIQSEQAKRVNI